MRIKEKLPWTIDSPSIHLVQPSDRVPMIHEVVSRQPSVTEDDTILFTLSNKEWKLPKQLKKEGRSYSYVEENKKEDYALKCGYISPTIHWQFQPRRSSSFDLRVGQNSSDERCNGTAGKLRVHKTNSDTTSVVSNGYSSTSLQTESTQEDKRKSLANFNDILKELQMDVCSRTNSETESCGAKTPTSERKCQTRSCETITRQNSLDSESNEVFYDIELNTEENEEEAKSKLPARKSFSEETFEQNRRLILQQKRNEILKSDARRLRTISSDSCDDWCEEMWKNIHPRDTRRVSQMVDELLLEIYGAKTCMLARRRSCMGRLRHSSVREEESSEWMEGSGADENHTASEEWRKKMLQKKDVSELQELLKSLQTEIKRFGSRLVRHLKKRDCFIAKRELHCDWITAYLQANSEKRSEDTRTRFSVTPGVGDSGFTQWVSGMRMVARLPEGIPQQFRKTLWLNLAEKHLASRGVNWEEVEDFCFNEYTNPDDEELGVQIVKDVHRTGCSLFCGTSGQQNQALLKRVLLAYARWNKAVGYCQGFNMLAALILQVMDRSEVDSVKVMIFLIEGVLPESYFANNLRGLSVDMAVFRDLLRLKLPSLSRHLEQLQTDSKDSGTSYEPPLTNVFTMQWFLTLFCNCLPQETVLRVWDLIFLEGNQILLCTALAIWNTLSDRIMSVESADEFYSIMGVLTREMLEFGLMDANNLIKAIVSINFPELGEMRERYLYNITPWTQSVSTVARRGLRLFYSDDDTDNEEEDEKIAIATAYGLFRSPKKKETAPSGITSPPKTVSNFGTHPDREKIAMDISALKKQYCKLRERQRQAHIILTAACGGQTLVGPTTSPAMNHLLLGKCALVNNKGRRLGPPQGAIPPPSKPKVTPAESKSASKSGETLHWKDTAEASSKHSKLQSSGTKTPECESPPSSNNSSRRGSSSSTSTELCDDPQKLSDSEDQTNSLSECYVVAESVEEKKQKKVSPDPVHSEFQKELTTLVEQNVKEIISLENSNTVIDVPEKDEYDIFKETAEKPRRKSSFKIDFQEMKELDRRLSLKISEIERASFEKRRSIIGITTNQGSIDTQVLFPFDRDYIKEEELSRNQSSDAEENEFNTNSDSEIISENLSINDSIQISVDLIEKEKQSNCVTSSETINANMLGENISKYILEETENQMKDSTVETSQSSSFIKDFSKSELDKQVLSDDKGINVNTLTEEEKHQHVRCDNNTRSQFLLDNPEQIVVSVGVKPIESGNSIVTESQIDDKQNLSLEHSVSSQFLLNEEKLTFNSNAGLNLLKKKGNIISTTLTIDEKDLNSQFLLKNEDKIEVTTNEELKPVENNDSIVSASSIFYKNDLSSKKSEIFTLHDQDLNLTSVKSQEIFQPEKSPQLSETISSENTLYFDESSFSSSSPLSFQYKTSKLTTGDVSEVEQDKIKHHAARRGSEIALSLILEENSQLLSKFQQSKRSTTLLDNERSEDVDTFSDNYNYTNKSEFMLSKSDEEEVQNASGSAEFDSKLHEIDCFKSLNVEAKHSSNLTDEQFNALSEFPWLSDQNNVQKDSFKSLLNGKEDSTQIKVQKIVSTDVLEETYTNIDQDQTIIDKTKFTSVEDNSFVQYKYKYTKDKTEDITKEKENIFENFGIGKEQVKSELLETSLQENRVTSKSKVLFKDDDVGELEYLSTRSKFNLLDSLKKEENKEFESCDTKRDLTQYETQGTFQLDKFVKDNSLKKKYGDNFDRSGGKYEPLASTIKDNVTSKLCCRRQNSLDYSPKSKFSGFSSQDSNGRRTSLSLDSGTTLKEEYRRTSTDKPVVETDSFKFSNFKFYTPVISEISYKHERFSGTKDVEVVKEKLCISEDAPYEKSLDFMNSPEKFGKRTHLTDHFSHELQAKIDERSKNTALYSGFKDTKYVTEIKTDKFYKSTFSFDSDSRDKEYKPRYSSLSPRRRITDVEADYLSSPSLERFGSPSPSKPSTSYSDAGLTVMDEKLQASSSRLSKLKSEKVIDCKDPVTEFMYDELDTKLRLGIKSISESKYECSEPRKTFEYTGSSPTSPTRFNPFPSRSISRQPKELGVKLGLYQPQKSDKSPSKRFS